MSINRSFFSLSIKEKRREKKEIKDEAGFTSLWSVTADKVDQEGIQTYTCTHIDSPSHTSVFYQSLFCNHSPAIWYLDSNPQQQEAKAVLQNATQRGEASQTYHIHTHWFVREKPSFCSHEGCTYCEIMGWFSHFLLCFCCNWFPLPFGARQKNIFHYPIVQHLVQNWCDNTDNHLVMYP